jgi:hypothetical protein
VSPGPAKVQDSVRPGNSELAEALLTKQGMFDFHPFQDAS